MTFFTLPWYVYVLVVIAVLLILYVVYRKPHEVGLMEPAPEDEAFEEVSEERKILNIFMGRLETLKEHYSLNMLSTQEYVTKLLLLYRSDCRLDPTVGFIYQIHGVRLKMIANTMIESLDETAFQEVSMKLVEFCETCLMTRGLNTEVFRHRAQVNQSVRLLEMSTAIMRFLSQLSQEKHDGISASEFIRLFNNKVVHGYYAEGIRQVVNAKKEKPHLKENRQHRRNREQRAKRLQQQARSRPKTS